MVPLRSFFLCYPGEALGGPILTGVSNKLNNIDSNNGILISQKYYAIYIYIYINRLRLRLNNHKKSIRDNSRGFPVAVHFNQPDHSLNNLRCVILRGDFKTTADRPICEQTFIHKLKTHSKGVNQDLPFLSPYSYFHQCCRPLTSTSVNNTEV